jgi:predicted TIM-barrel fold metal-dependent hydrolase
MAQALEGYKILSADDHTFEASDLWTTRMPKEYRDQAPVLRSLDDVDMWFSGDLRLVGLSPGAHPGRRYESDPAVKAEIGKTRVREEHIRPGANDPDERVKDLDIDGIDKAIHFSTVGLHLYKVADTELLHVIQQTWNDWMAEFCHAHPDRLYGNALLNPEIGEAAIIELERCKKMGLVGAMVPVGTTPGMRYSHAMYEPFWSACEDLEMPVALHIGCNRPSPDNEFMDPQSLSASFLANIDIYPRMAIGDMVFSGVFERHPKLQVGVIEFEVSWIPSFLERMNYTYTERVSASTRLDRYKFQPGTLPSDFWYNNCFVGTQEDPYSMRVRDLVGVDNIQFGADYPHDEGTFPKSRDIAAKLLADCTPEEKQKILWDNASRVYNIH